MFSDKFRIAWRVVALAGLVTGATVFAQDHAYQGTLGIWYEPVNNYGVNNTDGYVKWMGEHPGWHENPGFDLLEAQGGTVYSIEQPDRFAKMLRTMRRATADVVVVDSLDCHTDPWSYSIHYFADALENQPPDEKQLKWMYWLELWSTDRYGPGWYGPRWTRWKPRGAPYQSWQQVKQVLDYIYDNYAQKPHYYSWNGKPMLVIEADLIGKEKPEWFEKIMADDRFYIHFVSDTVHDLADYPSNWTDWVWPYWVDVNPKFNNEWAAALSGTAGEGKGQIEGLFDKRTGKAPAGGNSEPPKFILIPAYNDYVTGRDHKHAGWFEPLFDKDGHMSRFQYVDQIAQSFGRKPEASALDTEGKQYSLQPTIDKLTELLETDRQKYGMARIRDISSDEYLPNAEDMPVLSVELYPYRAYEASKSFETITSMSIRNVGTAQFNKTKPHFTEIQMLGDIDRIWLVDVSAIDGSRTRVGEFVGDKDGILQWVGQYPVHFGDLLVVTVDLTPTARKGKTLQFELVVDKANDAKAVEFVPEYGNERFSPIQTVRNKYAQAIGADIEARKRQ
jgi:hypothetical protein